MKDFFDESASLSIRKDIARYRASFHMVDTERAVFLGLPKGCRIREGAKIINQDDLNIGENCWIGENAILDASGGLDIGNNCSIGLGVYLWTHDSHNLNLTGKNNKESSGLIKRKKTSIGNNCFIAGPSVIMPGVTIGDGCVIAPMSVVYKDLAPGTIFTPYRQMHKLIDENRRLRSRVEDVEKKLADIEMLLKGK